MQGDARNIPDALVNDSIVKMSWAKKYIENEIIHALHNWNTPKGIQLLKKRLITAGYAAGNNVKLGESN
ncbi:DUF6402 family protein, partial [Aeromonas veronii]|uniref:DUF6402 family protein n=1 Tax=Aeromonas veronii TaxID=654 RepID=UPI0038B49F4D